MQEILCFSFVVVIDAPDTYVLAVDHQIGRPWVAIVGKAETACVRHTYPRQLPHKWVVNMPVNHDAPIRPREVSTFPLAGLKK